MHLSDNPGLVENLKIVVRLARLMLKQSIRRDISEGLTRISDWLLIIDSCCSVTKFWARWAWGQSTCRGF